MSKIKTFINALFGDNKPEEGICCAWKDTDTRVFPITRLSNAPRPQWISLNLLDNKKDNNPIEKYHSINKPRRSNANVTCFRNILIEFDEIPLEKQLEFVKGAALPYTTAVFSGSKSIHFIISLEEPLTDLNEYNLIVKTLYYIIKSKGATPDTKCKNPSRLTRFPGYIRNGKEQELLEVRGRVSKEELEQFMDITFDKIKETYNANMHDQEKYTSKYGVLSSKTLDFLMFGATEGSRNDSIFRAACEMVRAGYSDSDIMSKLINLTDLPEMEARRAIQSAIILNKE